MGKLPKWFGEGIAETFGSFERKGSKIPLCRLKPFIARRNLFTVQQELRRGTPPSLEDFVTRQGDGEFDTLGQLGYAYGWSFCHFLLAFPAQEATSMVVPQGKYSGNLKQFIETLREKGATARQAVQAAFSKTKEGGAWDWKKIEAGWKKYIISMRVRLVEFAFEEMPPELEGIEWERTASRRYVGCRSNLPGETTQRVLDVVDVVYDSLMHLFKIAPDKVRSNFAPCRAPARQRMLPLPTSGVKPNNPLPANGLRRRELWEWPPIASGSVQRKART
jgi:hypothetical protein